MLPDTSCRINTADAAPSFSWESAYQQGSSSLSNVDSRFGDNNFGDKQQASIRDHQRELVAISIDRRYLWSVLLVRLAALTACTSPAQNTDSATSTLASLAPSGAITVGCGQARAVETDRTAIDADDLVIGPLVYQGAVLAYQGTDLPGTPPSPDADGLTYFKTGAEVPPETIVTVSVGATARSSTGIVRGNGPAAGYSSVTYRACPAKKQHGRVWWAGGFSLVGKTSACLPSEVRVEGESDIRKVSVSLVVDPCGQ